MIFSKCIPKLPKISTGEGGGKGEKERRLSTNCAKKRKDKIEKFILF
jgi:hypothetical protein